MKLDYIVIRRKIDTGHLEGAGAETAAEPGPPISEILSVEKANLDDQEANEINGEPDMTAVMEMPVTLIAPCKASDFGVSVADDAVTEAKAAGMSWGIEAIGADMSAMNGAGVRVAVIDTGIDLTHPAFAGVTFEARNFLGGDPTDVSDRNGHGTHCAGTIFGRAVDGVRIGVAPGVTTAIIAKALDDKGNATTSAVFAALHWAGEQRANVISMSLGFDFPGMVDYLVSQKDRPVKVATSMALLAFRETLKEFEAYFELLHLENRASRGAVIAAASGNESQSPKFAIGASVPAASTREVISVGAAFRDAAGLFDIAPFSNINPRLCAPGVGVVSAKPGGGLAVMDGTSMACPHVAGVAALWWQSNKANGMGESGNDVRSSVVASAHPRGFKPDVTGAQRGKGLVRAP